MDNPETIKETVKKAYNKIVEEVDANGIDWWRSHLCEPIYAGIHDSYAGLEGYLDDGNLGLGCGFPVKYAGIKVGGTVLDLGCAAGIDSFIARQRVGERGKVIGIDITPYLIERARQNAEKLGYQNVIFIEADMEVLPIEDNTVDVIISNGVFSLVPHKERAFAEMYRVLRSDGHFCIADLTRRSDFREKLRLAAEEFTGCLNGISHQNNYLQMLIAAGFKNISLQEERSVPLPEILLDENLTVEERETFLAADQGLFAITIIGMR